MTLAYLKCLVLSQTRQNSVIGFPKKSIVLSVIITDALEHSYNTIIQLETGDPVPLIFYIYGRRMVSRPFTLSVMIVG